MLKNNRLGDNANGDFRLLPYSFYSSRDKVSTLLIFYADSKIRKQEMKKLHQINKDCEFFYNKFANNFRLGYGIASVVYCMVFIARAQIKLLCVCVCV